MSDEQGYIWPNLTNFPVTIADGKQGIDYLIVSPDQLTLKVYFCRPMTPTLEQKSLYRIEGGERITAIPIESVHIAMIPDVKDYLEIRLGCYGDWAPYRLIIDEAAWKDLDLDPVFSSIRFSFKIDCPKNIDCKSHEPGFERFPSLRDFDYQAKDYESLKQAMLDRLPLTIPDWWDRAEADFGIALVDLLAFVGDRLSYYQDRVAAEGVLATARSRESVARHLALIDYRLDPGEVATTYLCFDVDRDMTVPAGTTVSTKAASYEEEVIFSLPEALSAYVGLNRGTLRLYDFSHPSLMIPAGSCTIAVKGNAGGLRKGSLLLIENDEGGKHLVRLSQKLVHRTAPDGTEITLLGWDEETPLPWDLPLSGHYLCGNIALCYHGTEEEEAFSVSEYGTSKSSQAGYEDGKFSYYDLEEKSLAYCKGAPIISVSVDGEEWERTISLKESAPHDRHFQVIDLDNGENRILFGDNVNGMRPEKDSFVEVRYHAAPLGTAGNIAPGTLTRLVEQIKGVKGVANPFAGKNGKAPETEDHAKLWAPRKIREQKRAVTTADYEREVMSVAGVSRALARFVWTGSWYTVRITLDPEDTETIGVELKKEVLNHLRSRKMAGYDIQIIPAVYVPLEMDVSFCLNSLAFRDQVLKDLTSALGNGKAADGRKGFFHPDNWSFGKAVRLSSLYAAIALVDGIECAQVVTFKRLRKPAGNELETGAIPMQWDEIAQMDNDRNFPERGRLGLELVGGR